MSAKKKDKVEGEAAEAKPASETTGATAGQDAAAAAPQAAEGEAAALKNQLMRLQADFDNFRKRTQREKAEWSLSANEAVFSELLAVIDNFERGLKTAAEHKTEKSVQDGFQMVYDQMVNTLRSFGLVPIDVHESGFDHALHEAVAHIPSDEYRADEIIQQTRRGWKLGDKLLRPVQVVVSSGPGAPRDDESGAGGRADAEAGTASAPDAPVDDPAEKKAGA